MSDHYLKLSDPAFVVLQSRNETRRITELLTELPPEVDAEGLLVKTVVANKAAAKGGAGAPGNILAGPTSSADVKNTSKRVQSANRRGSVDVTRSLSAELDPSLKLV
jgi:hypothetical protein